MPLHGRAVQPLGGREGVPLHSRGDVRRDASGLDRPRVGQRADFQVMRDGQAQSKGVDQFTLVRDGSGWKIAVVAYTSMPVR